MQSGDGLLLRIRPRLGTFDIAALKTIARVASEFGSGQIDLTNRANLQLRGLTAKSHQQALSLLDEARLIDDDPDAEAVRNVVVDPLSGIDPVRADVRSFAHELESILSTARGFRHLPGKFGFSFSGSEDPHIGGRSTDIMVSVTSPDRFSIRLDDNISVAAVLSPDKVTAAITHLASVFLELRASDPAIGRMRDAVGRRGSAMIYAAAGLGSSMLAPVSHPRSDSPPVGMMGHSDRVYAAGVGLPFGRIDSDQLESLCALAAALKRDTVRMSPQRTLVFPVDGESQATAILREAERLSLIAKPNDLRLFFDVCPGSPACTNATTETRSDARRIAEALVGQALSSVHISGCEKGCARHGAAALTLVARHGRYDLICNDGPDGPVTLTGISPAEIDAAVARFVIEQTL
jgi:precorrin-3B synthase